MKLEIFDPVASKGRDKHHQSRPELICKSCGQELPYLDSHYVELGLIVCDDEGNAVRDAVVEVTTTDKDQKATLNGTGLVHTFKRPDDIKERLPYYAFHYDFKKKGNHKITLTVGDVSEVVELTAV